MKEVTIEYLSKMMKDYLAESKDQAKYGILNKDVYSGIKQAVEYFQSLADKPKVEG